MRTPRFMNTANGRRTATLVIAVSAFMTAGVAAAAAGGPTLPGFGAFEPAPKPAATEPTTTEPTTTEPVTTEAPPTSATTPTTEPHATEPHAAEPHATEPTTTPPPTEPPTTPAPKRSEPTPPPTTKPDTVVREGLHLECAVDNHTVHCHWTGGAVDGFVKYLLLRSDGRVVFMSDSPTADGHFDTDVAAGAYGYVVVEIDAAGKALVHSNRVAVQIGAVG